MVHHPRQFTLSYFSETFEFKVISQWFLTSYGSEGSREVKAKPMEALKRLGHEKLKLDEYESALTYPGVRL